MLDSGARRVTQSKSCRCARELEEMTALEANRYEIEAAILTEFFPQRFLPGPLDGDGTIEWRHLKSESPW
jgi:hypothetical protein